MSNHSVDPVDLPAQHTAWVLGLVERHFAERGGQLQIEDVSIASLAAEFGTPFYVYSERVLAASWAALRSTFPSDCAIYYSMKSNPHPAFLKFFLQRGAGIEVASAGELRTALTAGANPERIVFAGPGKTDAELALAIDLRLGEIHAESLGEVCRIARIATSLQQTAHVGLRVNPSLATAVGSLQMGGKPSPFGIDEEQLPAVLWQTLEQNSLRFVGLHLNTGTQLLDSELVLAYYRHAMELARRVAEQIGRPLRTLDLGGGLGIPYFQGQQELDLAALATGLGHLWPSKSRPGEVGANLQRATSWGAEQLLIEPGRFLVGPSGVYVTRVVDIKVSRGQTFIVLDGGMHHHLPASGNFGQMLRRPFPIAVLNRLREPPAVPVTVVGPLCTPLDTLAKNIALPSVQVGDLVGILQSGAYSRTASPLQFLGHPAPPEIWVHDGQCREIRRRGRWEDSQLDVPASDVPVSGTRGLNRS